MKTIAAPIVGGMITSTIHVLILVTVFFVMMKERALKAHPSPRGRFRHGIRVDVNNRSFRWQRSHKL
jgi:hypothetical protein